MPEVLQALSTEELMEIYKIIENMNEGSLNAYVTMAALGAADSVPVDSIAHYIEGADKFNLQLSKSIEQSGLDEAIKSKIANCFSRIHETTIQILQSKQESSL